MSEHYTPDVLSVPADKLRVTANYDTDGRLICLDVVLNDDALSLEDLQDVIKMLRPAPAPATITFPTIRPSAPQTDVYASVQQL